MPIPFLRSLKRELCTAIKIIETTTLRLLSSLSTDVSWKMYWFKDSKNSTEYVQQEAYILNTYVLHVTCSC